jgi:hypothetical protein
VTVSQKEFQRVKVIENAFPAWNTTVTCRPRFYNCLKKIPTMSGKKRIIMIVKAGRTRLPFSMMN